MAERFDVYGGADELLLAGISADDAAELYRGDPLLRIIPHVGFDPEAGRKSYDPSLQEIAERAAMIRSEWDTVSPWRWAEQPGSMRYSEVDLGKPVRVGE